MNKVQPTYKCYYVVELLENQQLIKSIVQKLLDDEVYRFETNLIIIICTIISIIPLKNSFESPAFVLQVDEQFFFN